MRKDDFDEFVRLLDDAYVFQKDLLSAPAKIVFFRAMAAYPLETVRAAMSAHMLDPKVGKWAMQPADLIAQIQGAAGNDGRPGAEEAWAIALTSRDEADTVVWTTETAEAFSLCQPILGLGDEVGARMAFKEAYLRLVTASRTRNATAVWVASLGWDLTRRTAVLTKAANAGLLPAPLVAGLLPPPVAEPAQSDTNALAQIDKIRKMMADMNAEKQRESDLHAQREREATADAKARANGLVEQYQRKDAA